jgi:hypothetical protein
MMDTDFCKPLLDYADYYATRDGRIISLKSGEARELTIAEKTTNGRPFLQVCLYEDGRSRTKVVSRLVYETFTDRRMTRTECNVFRDGNWRNCRFDNLDVQTYSDAAYDSIDRSRAGKLRNGRNMISAAMEALIISLRFEDHWSRALIASKTGCAPGTVSRVIDRSRK